VTTVWAAPVGAATEAVTGTATSSGGNGLTTADSVYSSPGVLGSGTIHFDFVLIPDPPGARTEGTGTLTRSDGATLTGPSTSTVNASTSGGFDVVGHWTVTSGTGGLSGLTGEIVLTGTVAGPGSVGDTFTMSGSLTTRPPVATDKDQCKDGGWQHLGDDQGRPFRNQGECVSFVTPSGTLVRVVDGDGNPFPAGTAGVQACGGTGFPACDPHVVAVDSDGDGKVRIELDPTTRYTINGFATNTGWPDPWVAPDGTEFHFSPTVTLPGADLQNGTVFAVVRPEAPSGTLVRVVDGDGNPFPAGTAAVQACGGTGFPACDPHVVAVDSDGDGKVRIELDPTTVYTINGFATNTGWPDPWVAPDGTEFHFSPTVTLPGADLQDGTVFVVARPSG
jgi:hypothetical protein